MRQLLNVGLRFAVMAGALAGLSASQAYAAGENCQRDALVIQSEVRAARDLLQEATRQSERCAAWRSQVVTLKRAASFYGRCMTGAEREQNVANANAGVKQFQGAYDQQCRGN